MRKRIKTVLAASALGASLLAAPVLAHDMGGSRGSTMGPGMMGQGGMTGMMSGMMNMMGMADNMAGMMEHCQQMMQAMGDHDHGSGNPNDQRRERAPSEPGPKG